jgi:hypothetical protein
MLVWFEDSRFGGSGAGCYSLRRLPLRVPVLADSWTIGLGCVRAIGKRLARQDGFESESVGAAVCQCRRGYGLG